MQTATVSEAEETQAHQPPEEPAETRLLTASLWVNTGLCIGAIVGVWLISTVGIRNIPLLPSPKASGVTILPWLGGLLKPEIQEQNTFHLILITGVASGVLFGWIARWRLTVCSGRSLRLLASSGVVVSLVTLATMFWTNRWSSTALVGPQIDLAAGSFAVFGIAIWALAKVSVMERSRLALPRGTAAPPQPGLANGNGRTGRRSIFSRLWSVLTWRDPIVLLILAAVIWIPDPQAEANSILNIDRMHHWNHFMLGPGLYAKAGAVAGLDFYSQYGSGTAAVWALLVRLGLDGSLESLLPLVAVLLILYYFVIWRVLLRLSGRPILAFLGTVLALSLELFAGASLAPGQSIFNFPSSTILRGPLDILILLTLEMWSRL